MADQELNQQDEPDLNENQNPEDTAVTEDQAEAASPLEALEEENARLQDRLLRAAAEMDNMRKRFDREVRDARQFAITGFARDMLTATDNLSRALLTMPGDSRNEAEGPLKSLIEGVEMTEREMQRLLEKNGIKKIEPRGEKFNPHFHQAMFEVTDTNVANNTVTEVIQVGYVIGERVLRPAMVGVAKGGAKTDTGAPDQAASDADKIDKLV